MREPCRWRRPPRGDAGHEAEVPQVPRHSYFAICPASGLRLQGQYVEGCETAAHVLVADAARWLNCKACATLKKPVLQYLGFCKSCAAMECLAHRSEASVAARRRLALALLSNNISNTGSRCEGHSAVRSNVSSDCSSPGKFIAAQSSLAAQTICLWSTLQKQVQHSDHPSSSAHSSSHARSRCSARRAWQGVVRFCSSRGDGATIARLAERQRVHRRANSDRRR